MATGICPWCGKEVDKFIMFRGDIVGCRYCGIHTKQTNADRIRGMTDEELAEVIKNPCDIGHFMPKEWCAGRNCGYQCSLDWLCEEAKVGMVSD